MTAPPPGGRTIGDHVPAHCCRHVFTPACPIDCLQVVLGTATFHALARAERAPFNPPATVGHVLELLRAGQLGLAAGLGPRCIGELQAGLVLAGLVISDATPAAKARPSRTAESGPPCSRDEKEEPPPRQRSPRRSSGRSSRARPAGGPASGGTATASVQ